MRSPALLAAAVVSTLSFACTSTVTGQGGGDPGSGTSSSGGGDPTVVSDGSGTNPPKGGTPADSTGEYDALFGPPETTKLTEDSIGGLWAGKTYYSDLRIKLTGSSITIAMKCTSQTIGMRVAAQVSSMSIRIVESQDVGQSYSGCSIQVRPQTLKRCENTTDIGCFSLQGDVLSFRGVRLFDSGGTSHDEDFTKLSD